MRYYSLSFFSGNVIISASKSLSQKSEARSILKDKGWDYLTTNKEEGCFFEEDGNWETQNSDGSGSYYGNDGSWGYKNPDGSASFYGSDGSWGYRNSDGSISYYGSDGTWGYKNADGTGAYYDNKENKDSFEDLSDDLKNKEDEESFAESIGKILGSSIAAVCIATAEIEEQKRLIRLNRAKYFCKKHKKSIAIVICIILLSILALLGYYQYSKLIPVYYNHSDLVSLSYNAVKDKLETAGFINISTIAAGDLTLEQTELEDVVFDIIINDNTAFNKNEKYPYDAEILVYYHTVTPVCSPISSKDIKRQNHLDIQKQFQEAGFVNISVEPIYDIVLGWFVSDGEIESITINGEDEFYKGEEFRPDDAVIIKHHTLRKNKPEK